MWRAILRNCPRRPTKPAQGSLVANEKRAISHALHKKKSQHLEKKAIAKYDQNTSYMCMKFSKKCIIPKIVIITRIPEHEMCEKHCVSLSRKNTVRELCFSNGLQEELFLLSEFKQC